MTTLGGHAPRSLPETKLPLPDKHERCVDSFGPLIAEQLRPGRRYALIRVGHAEFAYSDSDRFLRALGQAWSAGYVPDPLPSTLGRDLPDVAPNLRGVDCDLGDLTPSDVEPPRRRFS
jgi:hypothetical protein